jgi:isoquinoline 1-oxidoreductase subunit alpha
MRTTLHINGTDRAVDTEPGKPLLWVLREELGLKGTKFGCGIGSCGACTVHMDGQAVRSCVLPCDAAKGKITTIEGLARGEQLHPVQQAWIEMDVPQCGYCQAGQVMAVSAFLKQHPRPTDADIDAQLSNLCRCGTYTRMRAAVHQAAQKIRAGAK